MCIHYTQLYQLLNAFHPHCLSSCSKSHGSFLLFVECVKDYWLEVIIGLCIGILILGILALIIWKIVVTVHDKREYARFEKERQNAQWKSVRKSNHLPLIILHKTNNVCNLYNLLVNSILLINIGELLYNTLLIFYSVTRLPVK